MAEDKQSAKKKKLGKVGLSDAKQTSAKPDAATAYQQQIGELTEALQRERADAENIRRRHGEEIARLRTSVKASVVKQFLPVLDNLERSIKYVPDDLKNHDYAKGVQAVIKQLEKTFADLGVKRIETVGAEFDPHYHEAVSMEEGEGDREIVREELQSGFHIDDDVIRHAMVRVRPEK